MTEVTNYLRYHFGFDHQLMSRVYKISQVPFGYSLVPSYKQYVGGTYSYRYLDARNV